MIKNILLIDHLAEKRSYYTNEFNKIQNCFTILPRQFRAGSP